MGRYSTYNDVIKAYYDTSYLCHHGILGMKWGIRRFQNKDGTRTEAGKKRYGKKDAAEKLLQGEGISRSTYKIADREYGKYEKSNCGKDEYLISVSPEIFP